MVLISIRNKYQNSNYLLLATIIIGVLIIDQTSILFNFGKVNNNEQQQSISTIMSAEIREEISRKIVVVTTTYYPDNSDIRFNLAIDLCKLANTNNIHLIIVDDSPNHNQVATKFLQTGGYIHVYQQDKEKFIGKGGALRQSIAMAVTLLRGNNNDRGDALNNAVICFTEPEKVDLLNHIHLIAKPILDGVTDVVIPKRNDELFKQTYPIEQYHSESFGNYHFNLLAKQLSAEGFRSEGANSIDWLFGPFALKASLSRSWLTYIGTSWDAQIVPYVRGVRDNNWRITSVTVDFKHPKVMKEQEEGSSAFTKKRLMQLNLLFDLLGDKELTIDTDM